MDRIIHPRKKKQRIFKEFACIDLIPYSIALILLLAELYILCQFIRLYDKFGIANDSFAFL